MQRIKILNSDFEKRSISDLQKGSRPTLFNLSLKKSLFGSEAGYFGPIFFMGLGEWQESISNNAGGVTYAERA